MVAVALVEGHAVAAVAAGAKDDAPGPAVPSVGEACVLVDFELTLSGLAGDRPGVVALVPAAATADTLATPAFGAAAAVLVAFVTTLPVVVGCCEVTPAGAVPLGASLEGVLVA